MLEDSQIVARVAAGQTDSFGILIERYQMPVFRYLYRMTGSYDVALDLRQDTFVRAYHGIMKTEITVSFKAWLYRIATNNALQYFRRKRKLSFVPLDEKREDGTAGEAEDPYESIGERLMVRNILLELPPEQRTCMVLHFVEGFTYREIGDTLGISGDAVRKRVSRGSREFRRLYVAREVI